MTPQTFLNCSLILVGAIIMLISIVKTRSLMKAMPFIPERNRENIRIRLLTHRGLMIFFFIGYIIVGLSFAFRYSLLSETFVSIIFFLGAAFVFIGITVQSRLISEVQQTIHGILPICMNCKKIRDADGKFDDPMSWRTIEEYISKRATVNFSHSLCPECFKEEMARLDELKQKISE